MTKGLLVVLALSGCAPEPSAPREPIATAHTARPAPAAALEGSVVGPDGRPVAGAIVSAWSHFDLDIADPAYDERTDARGHFRFATLPAGHYGLTATSPSFAGAYAGPVDIAERPGTPPSLTLKLEADGAAVEGTIVDPSGAPRSNARVLAVALGDREGEVYTTIADGAGWYRFVLPGRAPFYVVADSPPHPRLYKRIEPASRTLDFRLGPPPAP